MSYLNRSGSGLNDLQWDNTYNLQSMQNSINSLNDYTKQLTISLLTTPNQIKRIGFYKIGEVDASVNNGVSLQFTDYATGDFHCICPSYNGNGDDEFNFGNILFFSPRWTAKFWIARVWNGVWSSFEKYTANIEDRLTKLEGYLTLLDIIANGQ